MAKHPAQMNSYQPLMRAARLPTIIAAIPSHLSLQHYARSPAPEYAPGGLRQQRKPGYERRQP
jgi:hypothetical protein